MVSLVMLKIIYIYIVYTCFFGKYNTRNIPLENPFQQKIYPVYVYTYIYEIKLKNYCSETFTDSEQNHLRSRTLVMQDQYCLRPIQGRVTSDIDNLCSHIEAKTKVVAILQSMFSNSIHGMKISVFGFVFHSDPLPWVQLPINQHCF